MSYRQLRFLLPWKSVKASLRHENESSRRSSEPKDETQTSASLSDTEPTSRHQPVQSPEVEPEQPPLAPAQAPERSETMPRSQSKKEKQVYPQPASHSRAKKQTRTASKPPSSSKAIPQTSAASKKYPSASGKVSPSQDTSKPSSPAGKASLSQDASKPSSPSPSHNASKPSPPSPSHNASKPSSPAGKASPSQNTSKPSSPAGKASPPQNASKPSSPAGKASPSQNDSKPSLPAGKASPSQDASKPSSSAAAAPRSRISSKPPSPSPTSSKNHLNSKSISQSRLKADSQPSSSSRSAFPPQASSIPRSPSQENSQQQPSKKTSRVQSPSHSSSKPTTQATSRQHIEPPAAIGDQTTNEIISHPTNQSPQPRPKSMENQLQTESKQSPKPDLKPVESKASKDQPETKEELTSKNTSYLHSNQDSSETPIESDQTIENSPKPSQESQAESKENKERKNDKEDVAKTTNALQTNPSRSTLITSSESTSPFEPENRDSKSQQEETKEDLSKAFQKLKIKYSDEENPKSFTTLIGDNKGAAMSILSGEAKRESSIHINREYKSNPDESPKNSTDIEAENFNHEKPQDSRTEEDSPLELYININVQGINNSIMSNSSFTENNPGFKLKFIRDPTKSEDESESHQARKAKYTAKPAERVTYEPTLRRRCLGGLLMESSDSELDNPEKPRRHGCRYSGSRKGKDAEIV